MRNKSLRRIGLESRIEDLVEESTVVVADPAAAVPGAEVVPAETVIVVPTSDAELAAVAEAQAEAGDTTDAIDELAVVADRLNEVRSNIEATIPNGGLTQGEAVAYQCATNAIVADVGVTDVLPAMENFGASMSRKEATTASLEALDKVVEKVIARGKELMVSLGEKLMKLIQRIVAYFTSDKARLEKLKAALNSANGGSVRVTMPTEIAALMTNQGASKFFQLVENSVGAALNATKGLLDNPAKVAESVIGKSILPGASKRPAGKADSFSSTVGLVELTEIVPHEAAELTDYELTIDNKGDGTRDVTLSKSDVAVVIDVLLKEATDSKLKAMVEGAAGKAVTKSGFDNLESWANNDKSEGVNEIVTSVRHIAHARLTFATQAVSLYGQIFQGLVSSVSKTVSKLNSAEAGKLENKA